jgi:hypothetical protein
MTPLAPVLLLLIFPLQARADEPWIGKRVLLKRDGTYFRIRPEKQAVDLGKLRFAYYGVVDEDAK